MESMGEPRKAEALRPGWGVLAMRTVFNPEAAVGIRETYEFRVDGDVFHVAIDDGRMQARQGPAPDPEVVITTDVETLLRVGARQVNPLDAIAQGKAQLTGDPAAALRCVEIFGFPRPARDHEAPSGSPGGWGAATMRGTFNPKAAAGVRETYEMHVGDEVFHMTVDDGECETAQGPAARPDFVLSTDVRTFMALGARQITPMDAAGRGLATMKGDVEAAMRCVEIFGMRMT
jgi:putative sterol carrier protein